MKKITLALLGIILVSVSCAKSESTESGTESSAAGNAESPIAYLELCYATSINMPEKNFGPENVFDNKSSTYWATMPGAGVDEGLFFSFIDPIAVQAIHIEPIRGKSSMEEITAVKLYVNGWEGPEMLLEDEAFPIGDMVKSIFIRISGVQTPIAATPTTAGVRQSKNIPAAISRVSILVNNENGEEVPLKIIPLAKVGGQVEASSSLEPLEAYHTDFLFDSRPEFGWADGNTDKSGEGESLRFRFDKEQRIEKIKIWNGYQRSPTHFSQNERAAEITFGSGSYRLIDGQGPQIVQLESPLSGKDFTMNINSVYKGSSYKDLVISEMQFFNGKEWFIIESTGSEARKKGILEWARNTFADTFVDRQVYTSSPAGRDPDLQSIIFRSNGSFVLWKYSASGEAEKSVYADGNWQILDNESIRIFGRLHRMETYSGNGYYNPYAGAGQGRDTDRTTIFSDTVRFGRSSIRSDRKLFEPFTL